MMFAAGLIASAWLAVPVVALAQGAAPEEDILITGQRQAYLGDFTLQETPKAVAVITATMLADVNSLRLTEALDLTASVARQNNFGGLWDAYAVRGFAGDENLPSGYLVNGFNGGRGFGGTRDVAGIERIEVLKGPNAALFGRGEPGGTVNIVTKRPTAEFAARAGLLVGSFDRYRLDADVNVPAGSAFAVRAVGFFEDAGSFRNTLKTQRYGLLPSVLAKLGEATSLTYELELTRQKAPFDRGIPAINGVLGAVDRRTFLGEPGDGPIEANATGHQVQIQHNFSANWSLLLGGTYRDTSLDGFSTEGELVRSRQRLLVDGQSLSRQRRLRDYDSKHAVIRAELAGQFATGAFEHRLIFGTDYDDFENDQVFLRFRPPVIGATTTPQAANDINVFNPVYGRFPLPAVGPQTDRLDKQHAWGVYLQDQIRLTDQLQVRLGGRYDSFEVSTLNRLNNSRSSQNYSRFSPQAGVVFEASPTLSVYAAFGQGFRANLGADARGNLFKPETSESYEIGAKALFLEGKLSATLALFSMTKENILTADPTNPGFSTPIGKARSQGVEFDVNGTLPGDIALWLSYAYVDAQSRADALDPNFSLAIRVGDPLINVPKHSVNLQLSRTFQLWDTALKLGGGVQHVSDRLGETATRFRLPGYTLVRLFGSWTITDHLEVAADVSNLFDETYYTNSFAALWVAPGAPRAASLSLRVKY
jgi:iron complex outermembrane recepter protein